jgi:hypothetical protein
VLPEALEKWSVELMSNLLPRISEIIFEINRRWLGEVRNLKPESGSLILKPKTRNTKPETRNPETGSSGDTTRISPYSGRDCVKSLRSSYAGLYPQRSRIGFAVYTLITQPETLPAPPHPTSRIPRPSSLTSLPCLIPEPET